MIRNAALVLAALVLACSVLAACSGANITPLPSGAEPPADCARVDADGVIAISADHATFSAPCMVATAGQAFTIHFTNMDGEPHNVAAYQDSTKTSEIFRGEIISGPDQSLDYPVDALTAGQDYFECTVHPTMSGSLYVVAAGN